MLSIKALKKPKELIESIWIEFKNSLACSGDATWNSYVNPYDVIVSKFSNFQRHQFTFTHLDENKPIRVTSLG